MTDMPKNPGEKGGKGRTKKKVTVPIIERKNPNSMTRLLST